MIIKASDLFHKTINKKYYLLYGNNIGYIEDALTQKIIPNLKSEIKTYEESDFLNNIENFKEEILNKSFFDEEKLIIIKRISDKIFLTIDEIISKKIEGISIILIADMLDKKSKIRNMFETNINTVCVPFYEDTNQSLKIILLEFLKKKKINLSNEAINLIIGKANGSRIHLKNELRKIEEFALNKKTISINEITKLINIFENYSHQELVNSSLTKSKNKIIKIFNENNFTSEDCIIILRTLLAKLKRLLIIKKKTLLDDDIDKSIDTFKPTIFWKEKEIVKEQIKILSYQKIQEILLRANEIELLSKKNPILSTTITTNFLIEIAA